jgi:hypothetical protein
MPSQPSEAARQKEKQQPPEVHATNLYRVNPCSHLRGPDGACIGHPTCNRKPVDLEQLPAVMERAAQIHRVLQPPSPDQAQQALPLTELPKVGDLLGAALVYGDCLAVILGAVLQDRSGVLSAREREQVATIGLHIQMRAADVRELLASVEEVRHG